MDYYAYTSEILNVSSYSNLQKGLLLLLASFLISWIKSCWNLFILYIIGVALGLKISNLIVTEKNLSIVIKKIYSKINYFYNYVLGVYKYYFQEVKTMTVDSRTIDNCESSSINFDHKEETNKNTDQLPNTVTLELNSIQLLIVRDFVNSWFSMFSLDSQFPKDIKHILFQTFTLLSTRLSQQRCDECTITFLKIYQHHLANYQKAKSAYESHKLPTQIKIPQDNIIKRLASIESAFSTVTKLHFAVQSESNELLYLKGFVNLLLSSATEPYLSQGQCVKILLTEILAYKVFLPLIKLISNPDWLMDVIIFITADGKYTEHDVVSVGNDMLSHDDISSEIKENYGMPSCLNKSLKDFLLDENDIHSMTTNMLELSKSQNPHLNTNENLNELDKVNSGKDCSNMLSLVDTVDGSMENEINSFSKTLESVHTKRSGSTIQKEKASQMLPEDEKYDISDHQIDPSVSKFREDDTRNISVYSTEENSDEFTSSITTLDTLKNFMVSLKPGNKSKDMKKPKSLPIFTDDSLLIKKESEVVQMPPQVFIEETSDEQTKSSYLLFSDSDVTPSPGSGFFPGALFGLSLSSSSQDLNDVMETPDFSLTSASDQLLPENYNEEFKENEGDTIKAFGNDDMRLFQDIAIPEAFPYKDEKSSSTYSLYTIEYEALYFTEEGKSVIRSGTVKRRYREFTHLHSRLEAEQAYKQYIKNIKGPKRWSVPFMTLDKETVEARRIFLEKYLQTLINIEAICNGPDLREFLAYEGSSHIAFVKKSPDIMVPRIDKFLMRSVSGVVDKIKSLPSIPQEMISGLRGRDLSAEKLMQSKTQSDPDGIEVVSEFTEELPQQWPDQTNMLMVSCDQLLKDLITSDHTCEVTGDDQKILQMTEFHQQEIEKALTELQNVKSFNDDDSSDAGFTVVLEMLAQALQDHWLCRERVLTSIKSLLGQILEASFKSSLSKLTSEEQVVSLLTHLRETIWPHGQFKSTDDEVKSEWHRAQDRAQAKQNLINIFPEMLKICIGKQQFENLIEVFLSSIEYQQLNKQLIYQTLDVLMEWLFPEVTNTEFLNTLFLHTRC